MPNVIELRLKRAAVILAETLDYELAAMKLGVTASALKSDIETLEEILCLRVFRPELEMPTLTDDGRFLVQVLREALLRGLKIES